MDVQAGGGAQDDRVDAGRAARPKRTGVPGPRVIVTGDRAWAMNELAAAVLRRLGARYGPDLIIVHGDATGVDQSFCDVCNGFGYDQEPHPAAWDRLGNAAGSIRRLHSPWCGKTVRPRRAGVGSRRRQIPEVVPRVLVGSDLQWPTPPARVCPGCGDRVLRLCEACLVCDRSGTDAHQPRRPGERRKKEHKPKPPRRPRLARLAELLAEAGVRPGRDAGP